MFVRALSLARAGLESPGPVSRYALSIVSVATAVIATSNLGSGGADAGDVVLFFGAVLVTGLYAGAGPCWLAALLSAGVIGYHVAWPGTGAGLSPKAASLETLLAAFILCGALVNAISVRRHRTEEALRRTRDELEARTLELRQINERLTAEMTDRSRAERRLRQTQSELARGSRMMNLAELAASIAHEINQPLAAIVSNAEAARNWLRRSTPAIPEAAESIEAVMMGGVRAAEIIARVRRLISKAVPRQAVVDVNEVVSDVLKLASADLARRDIKLECRLAPGLPTMNGDRIQLQQMLLNLVNNAIDAMSEVSDRTRELRIETRAREAGALSLTVADSGHGLMEADTVNIFQPFYSTKQEGMGIGLSVCRTIAESHGGVIRAMSGFPHGAVFEVNLPAGGSRD